MLLVGQKPSKRTKHGVGGGAREGGVNVGIRDVKRRSCSNVSDE